METLDYAQPVIESRANTFAWIIAFSGGIPVGFGLSLLGSYALACVAITTGWVLGSITSLAAGSKKIAFGFIATAVASGTCICCVLVREGMPNKLLDLALACLVVWGFVAVPGLLGSVIVAMSTGAND